MKCFNLVFVFLIMIIAGVSANAQNRYVHAKNGNSIVGRRIDLIVSCIKSRAHDTSDVEVIAICKCGIDLMNHNFTDNQLQRHITDSSLNLFELLSEDSTFDKRALDCWHGFEQDRWQAFRREYIAECKKTLQEATQKPLDPARIDSFGRCQLEMVLSGEVPSMDIKMLDDPNSNQFHKVVQKCGSPFKS